MSVVDYFLNNLVAYLQKKQKARKKRKTRKRRSPKNSRKNTKSNSVKRRSSARRRKIASPKGRIVKRPVKKTYQKSSSRGKKQRALPGKKVTARKTAVRPKDKPGKVKKTKKAASNVAGEKNALKEMCIGEITHFFSRIQVVVLKMTKGKLVVGDRIHVKGRKTDFIQKVKSLQIESVEVKAAHKGQLVGLKVSKAAKAGDKVFIAA